MTTGMSLTPGLCSVTFRALSPERVLEVTRASGLRSIEWGGDVHVPVGDLDTAARVRALSADAGVEVASYGSYLAPGADDPSHLPDVLRTASALGAPTVRVWAGRCGSADADATARAAVVTGLRSAAQAASAEGLDIALEFHRGTLTDTAGSTARLLDEVGASNVSTYWQPPVAASDADAIDGLATVLDRVSHVHVFSWDDEARRFALHARAGLWQQVVEMLGSTGRRHHLHLEFVADDSPDQFATDAAFLRSLITRTGA
ncbi:MAG: sugar phosphate isomerase/epimerase family protein [Streptosporangiales bacterium]